MVIHFNNKHVDPLIEMLNIARDVAVTPEHHEVITVLELAVEQETQKSPYRLWLRANPTKEKAP